MTEFALTNGERRDVERGGPNALAVVDYLLDRQFALIGHDGTAYTAWGPYTWPEVQAVRNEQRKPTWTIVKLTQP